MTGTSPNGPIVSVIMNCLNGEAFLRQALDSVFSQTFEDWEVIFWEDLDSIDRSGEIARSYGCKVRYFKAEEKLPLYGARNRAIEKAEGRYIAILDCDDIWMDTKLVKQVELFEKDCEVGLVCCDTLLFNSDGVEKRLFEFKRPSKGRVFRNLLCNNFITTSSVMLSKKTFAGSVLFDERLHMSGDYDAWLRVSRTWKVDFPDGPLVRYRVHPNSITWTEGRRLVAFETGIIADNLKKSVNGFEDDYAEGLRSLLRRSDIQKALMDWEGEDGAAARRHIRRYAFDGLAYFTLYLLMYLPYKRTYHWCYKAYNRNISA